jgi:phage shock protein E
MKKLITTLVVGVALLSACSTSSTAAITDMSVSEFADIIATQDVVILDVRTPGEFAAGHIANAINIDAESGNFETEIQFLDKTKTYAVYCQSGRRSGIATETMANAGFLNLYNMMGGTIDWTNSGYPLTTN